MSSERCAFRKYDGTGGIRDLVYREHQDRKLLDGHRYWFFDHFEKQLTKPPDFGGTTESNREIIDLWLNTQIAHAGAKDPGNKKPWDVEMMDFDKCATRIGRVKFEFLFRTSLRVIGSLYINFEETLAFPLFSKLRTEQGMTPSFEAEMALKYNPYPSSSHKIIFDDVFWHLNRETMEETFERLLARQYFSGLQSFLRGLFSNKKQEALACVCECETFDTMLKASQAVMLEKDSRTEDKLLCRSGSPAGHAQGRMYFDVFEGRMVRFHDDSKEVFSRVYVEFRTRLFELRKEQRQRIKWEEW